jgi:predicted PurR-regulated permease PerM
MEFEDSSTPVSAGSAARESLVTSAPINVRNKSLVVIATLACLFTLHWASAVFIPVMVGLLFSYALSPVVSWLQARGLARALSAAVLILGMVGGVGALAYTLADDANKLVESLPTAARKLHDAVRSRPGRPDNTITTVQKAAAQLEQAAEDSAQPAAPHRGVQRVQIVKSKFDIKDHVWSGTMGALATLGQVGTVSLIAFFLLASGDLFRRKLVKVAGPSMGRKRVTLQAVNQINDQIQRYMLVQLFTSVVVGIGTWLSFWALGLENAGVWGVAAGVLNLVPYIGSIVVGGGSALVAFLQFGSLEMALLVSGASFAIHAVVAFLLTPWLTSRANKMNPVAIFIGVLTWGWLWGVWGLLLGVPILVAVKAICARLDDFKAVAEFLGD